MDEMHFMADVILRWFYVAISISNFIYIIISFLVDCICHWTPLKWIMLMPNDGGTGKLAEWERDTSDRNLFIGKIGRNHRFILNSVSARCLCFNCYNNLIIDYKTKNKAIFIQFSGISKETYHVHIQHKKTRHHNRPPNSQKLQHSNVLAQFPFTVIEICIFNMTINTLFFLPNFQAQTPTNGNPIFNWA